MKGKSLLFLAFLCFLSCQNAPAWQNLPVSEWPPNEGQYALLMAKDGSSVLETYYNDGKKNKLCNVQSLTKSIMALLVGIAIDQGKIDNVNQSIATYFPTTFSKLSDKRKTKISIEHLLNQTTGLEWAGYLEHEEWLKSDDPSLFVLAKKMEAEPGSSYNYNSGATHLISQIITKTTGKSTLEFAQENLFTPLNINNLRWETRNDGHHDGSGLGLWMQADDLLKIGQLVLNKGQWKGQEVISRKWINILLDPSLKSKATFGLPRSKHGYCWYHTDRNGLKLDYGMGYGGQFIFLFPEKDIVLVTTHNHDTADGIDQQVQFLTKYLPGLVKQYVED